MAAFVPYLVVGAIGIIGEWLIGPPKVNLNAMPQINQSLRGSMIPVTFGTNRVSAQVVWQNNFRAAPYGGKKGGGSGGLGSAKGMSGSQQYNYYMDLIFQYGMVDQPSYIGRAWIGQDPLDKSQVEALDAGLDGVNFALVGSAYTSSNSLTGTITYTEAFLAPGYPTGSDLLESWSYFETVQDGLFCQWPSTFWIGFEGYSLGLSGQIGQLGVELVPLNVGQSEGIVTQADLPLSGVAGSLWNPLVYGSGVTVDSTGLVYKLVSTDGGGYFLTRCLDADLSSALAIDNEYYLACNGSPYILGVNLEIGSGNYILTFDVWQVNSLTSITLAGTVTLPTVGTGWPSTAIGTHYDGSNLTILSDFSARLVSLQIPISEIIGGTVMASHVDDWILDNNVMSASNWIGADSAHDFAISGTTILPFVPTPDGKVLFYVGVADYNYIVANANSNTTGWNTLLGVIAGPSLVELADNVFTPIALPWTDAGKDLAGALTGNTYDDYCTLNFDTLGNLNVARSYSSTGDRGASGTFSRFTTYTWPELISLSDVSLPLFDLSLALITDSYPAFIENAVFASAAQYVWFGGPTHATTQGFAFGQLTSFTVNSLDVTPPYIIYQILTNENYGFNTGGLFGLQLNATTVDNASYQDAVQYCIDNGIFVSVTYSGSDSVLNTINELMSLYSGFMTEENGIIYFGVLRDNDVPMRVIDNTHLISPGTGKPPVDVTKAALQDTYNTIEVQFLDRNLEYNQNAIWVSDEVDVDFNGPRIKTYQAKYVMTGSTAQTIGERALWNNLYGRDQYNFKLGVKDADLRAGRIITLVDSFDATLSTGVDAIITEWQEQKRFEFTVKAVRIFTDQLTAGHGYTQQSTPGQGLGNMVDAVQPPLAMRAYELPYRFHASEAFLYFGYNQQDKVKGAQLWLSQDGASYTLNSDVQPFPVSGLIAGPLPWRPQGYVETNVDIYLMPTSSFNANTPTYVQMSDVEDTSVGARQAGFTCIMIGSEAVACENAIIRAPNHYTVSKMFRGWGGTPIAAQNSGAYWSAHGIGMFEKEIAIGDVGKIVYYKILPYNFAGNLCDISSVNAQTYQIRGDFWLPSEQPETRFFINSAASWPSSTPIVGPEISVASGGCAVILNWRAAANAEGFGFGGSGNGGAGHFAADTSTPSYRVDVASSNGTKVSSFVVNSGYFDYTLAQNSADFSGFAQSLIFTVTPFNSLGDGYAPFTSSLQLIW